MNDSVKTSITVIVALFLSFTILFVFIETQASIWKDNKLTSEISKEDAFFSQDFEKNTIFLLGSSQVGRINVTSVDEIISVSYPEYEIYNLATNADKPKLRLKTLDRIISAEPEIILYGVGYRDFTNFLLKSEIDKPKSDLPDPSDYFNKGGKIFSEVTNIDFDKIGSAKIHTIKAVKSAVGIKDSNSEDSNSEVLSYSLTSPFYTISKPMAKNLTNEELKRELASSSVKLDRINHPQENENFISLKQIVSKFKENNIKIIIYSVPYTKFYLDTIPEDDKKIFDFMLLDLSKEFNVPVYFLHDKYINVPIWNGNDHILYGDSSIAHNSDIAEIILELIES